MSDDGAQADNYLSQIRQVLQAASAHDLQALRRYTRDYSFPDCKVVDVQDPASGQSPLHAVIYSCASLTNGESLPSNSNEDTGSEAVRFLLEHGAIWNQLDNNNETPGCAAYRLGLESLYQLMVDAGVRAEMLLSRLDDYERLEDGDEEPEDEQDPSARPNDDVAGEAAETGQPDVDSSTYLSSELSFSGRMLLDEQQNGVMMAWESDIMLKSANAFLIRPNLRILNIGFGMGIVDTHIQNHPNKPSSHHIIEAHPEVLASLQSQGWQDKPGVVVHAGKWQDVLPQLITEGHVFDAIYFDTFAESYADFRDFFSEQVIGLLDQEGRWSFFNGMGADRQLSYDVYQKVVEYDLFEAGFDVEWESVALPKLDKEWEGVRRKYWNVDEYRLPVCRFMD
ncbi:hypothetical protein B0A52_03620 [Exophiala mesophila]|uniref:Arginine N-methyltransferase 2 n=1 Tax=Exophiala mesophila TaxID=212818 RepID=A0A438N9I2_EXOME|nr:hypothetical protein B0A52_03620 [Exophiala mesophila]